MPLRELIFIGAINKFSIFLKIGILLATYRAVGAGDAAASHRKNFFGQN